MTSTDRKIRVMHVIPWLDAGGVERRRAQLATGLDPQRFEQRLVCMYAKEYEFADTIRDAGVEVVSFESGRGTVFDVRTIYRVLGEVHQWRPDIIHGAVFEGVTLAALAGRLGRVPHIVVEETGDPSVRSWRGDALLAGLARLAEVAVGVSPPITDYLADELQLGRDRVALIMNGVDSPRDPGPEEVAKARADFGFTDDDFVIGSAGRIDNAHKRFTDLVTAVARLSEDRPDVKLLIVGSGGDIEMIENSARQAGISHRVVMAGYQSDMGLMYHCMDVFALASRQESFGLVIAEAMHCGVPIVATRVGGIPHIVDEDTTGLLVEPFQPRQMAEALLRIHDDAPLRVEMGRLGRERAREQFGADRYVRDVEALYTGLMNRSAP